MALQRLFIGAGAALLAAPAAAQVNPSQVQPADIIVTAPTPLSDVGEDALAFPAQTASDEEIEASHAASITDYLKRMTGGVFVNDVQNNPLQPDINYRGFTASPLLGTAQGLSLYMDGVRLNQPFGDVVSWDLIPKSAIRSMSLVPGSNPLFGRNSLGGALSVRTKDGRSDPGYELEGSHGSFRRSTLEAQAGGSSGATGLDWFLSADYFKERGWRDHSPSEAGQMFGKLGWSDAKTRITLSGSFADTDLNGNGLQEMRLLNADRASVYTYPDTTKNRAWLTNLTVKHEVSDHLSFSGNLFRRQIRTRTFNGDINDDALGADLYQPDAAEQAALTAGGYGGFPVSGESQANTPFPQWRCIANVLLNSAPNEMCNGLANRSTTSQREWGATGELTFRTPVMGAQNALTLGFAYVHSRAHFTQSTQFGYLTPDRGIVPVEGDGSFADGTQDSDDAFDARVDLVGRTTGISAYALDALDLGRLHVDLSARYDHTTIHNRDGISPGGGTGSLDTDQRFQRLNPALALRYTLATGISLDVAIAQTSRAPSAVELGCADPESPCRLPNALAGDPPLPQVVARTIEGGINATVGGITGRAGAFRTVSRNDILFVADDASGFGYFRNFGRTRRQGIDVDMSGKIGPVRLSGHYTLLDATYRSAETVDGSANSAAEHVAPGFEGEIDIARGDRIPLIPRHIAKASASVDPVEHVSVSLDMIAVSGVYARGNENNQHQADGIHYLGAGKTDAYAVFNMGVEIRPVKALTLFAQASNLFDTHYASAAQLAATGFDAHGNFVSRPFAAPVIDGERPLLSSTFYAPGAPRTIQVGARVRF
jgi:outer membrane receptor protein involved in Fe transport